MQSAPRKRVATLAFIALALAGVLSWFFFHHPARLPQIVKEPSPPIIELATIPAKPAFGPAPEISIAAPTPAPASTPIAAVPAPTSPAPKPETPAVIEPRRVTTQGNADPTNVAQPNTATIETATYTLSRAYSIDAQFLDTVSIKILEPEVRLGGLRLIITMHRESDFNHDETVDNTDLIDFLAAFAAGDASADFNHDGVIDLFDYRDFNDAFVAGH